MQGGIIFSIFKDLSWSICLIRPIRNSLWSRFNFDLVCNPRSSDHKLSFPTQNVDCKLCCFIEPQSQSWHFFARLPQRNLIERARFIFAFLSGTLPWTSENTTEVTFPHFWSQKLRKLPKIWDSAHGVGLFTKASPDFRLIGVRMRHDRNDQKEYSARNYARTSVVRAE